jgi:hypothetical protein
MIMPLLGTVLEVSSLDKGDCIEAAGSLSALISLLSLSGEEKKPTIIYGGKIPLVNRNNNTRSNKRNNNNDKRKLIAL